MYFCNLHAKTKNEAISDIIAFTGITNGDLILTPDEFLIKNIIE